jgi:hypothetical protein
LNNFWNKKFEKIYDIVLIKHLLPLLEKITLPSPVTPGLLWPMHVTKVLTFSMCFNFSLCLDSRNVSDRDYFRSLRPERRRR